MKDLQDEANRSLTDSSPSDDIPPLGPEPGREPVAPEPAAAGSEANVGQPGAPAAAPAPEPGAIWCAQCAANVVPRVANHCPVCGGWVVDNTANLVHGLRSAKLAKQVDAYRVDLIEQLLAERGGRDALDTASRIAIENYALVCAQHKTIEARLDQDGLFTQTGRRRSAFDMLKSISETIDRLRGELPPLPSRAIDSITEVRRVIVNGMSPEQLADRAEQIAKGFREEIRAAEAQKQRAEAHAAATARPATTTPVVQEQEQRVIESAPQPQCAYGCGSLTRCAENKETNLAAWRALHHTDPDEVRRRDQDERDQLEARRRGWPLPHMVRERELTEEEKRQERLRRELGWDAGTRKI